jgi:hypothetical protein
LPSYKFKNYVHEPFVKIEAPGNVYYRKYKINNVARIPSPKKVVPHHSNTFAVSCGLPLGKIM